MYIILKWKVDIPLWAREGLASFGKWNKHWPEYRTKEEEKRGEAWMPLPKHLVYNNNKLISKGKTVIMLLSRIPPTYQT
jgi:hypothetical protein